MVNCLGFKCRESLPARTPRIHYSGNPNPKSKPIRRQGIESITVSLVWFGPKEIMGMYINQSRGDKHTFGLNYLYPFCSWDMFCDFGNGIPVNGHIHYTVNVVFGINEVAPFNKDAVSLAHGRIAGGIKCQYQKENYSFHSKNSLF